MVQILFWLAVAAGLCSSLFLAWKTWRRPEHMAVMNWVWPLVALSGGPLIIWLYRRQHRPGPKPFAVSVAVATCHCGAGCTAGDLLVEGAMAGGAMRMGLVAGWAADTAAAFLLGIVFQYFAIAPMRGLGLREGLVAALKADVLSLLAWQAGMIGTMALVQYGVARLEPNEIEFWFAMQIAMLAGFAVAYPVNWWLVKTGVKEAM